MRIASRLPKLVCVALLALAPGAQAAAAEKPSVWAVDPAEPGPDLPPRGRSLFDFVASVDAPGDVGGKRRIDLPFPFQALVRRLEERAGCGATPCARQVLIPLGRSLQRTSAAPDFFRHPRVVATIDSEPPGAGPLLKDRIYLGYQQRSDLIEVISYNEAAARFEFQLVRGYRDNGTPQIVYARRAICVACHQNHAPIFSRQLWDETNANPRIAALLEREQGSSHGVAVRRGVDVPNAIDDATDRANLFSVWQLLWRHGCGAEAAGGRCRAALLLAALQYRLSDGRGFDRSGAEWREAFLPQFERQARTRWPGTLALPNPDVPNRDPLQDLQAGAPGRAHVPAALEPLAPRPPLDQLSLTDRQTPARLVAGLAQFIAAADVAAFDAQLARLAAKAPVTITQAPCAVVAASQWLRFDCSGSGELALHLNGRIELDGAAVRGGKLQRLALAGSEPLAQLDIARGSFDTRGTRLQLLPASGALSARLVDGRRIAAIDLQLASAAQVPATRRELQGQASVSLVDDRKPLREAIAQLASGTLADADQPFVRVRLIAPLLARLGANGGIDCCADSAGLPAPQVEPEPPSGPTAGAALPFAPFFALCARCHASEETSPPNFLAGSGDTVAANIRQCAPRIHVRLAQWELAPAARVKTPMPPAPGRSDGAAPGVPVDIASLRELIAAQLQQMSGSAPQLDRLLAAGYEALPPCLIQPPERNRRP